MNSYLRYPYTSVETVTRVSRIRSSEFAFPEISGILKSIGNLKLKIITNKKCSHTGSEQSYI